MRMLIFFASVILFCSSSCENTQESNSLVEQSSERDGTIAIVTTEYADQGCKVLLEIEEDGQKLLLMPIELEEKYRKHGTKISIEFHASKIGQSECQIGRPIVIDQIILVE